MGGYLRAEEAALLLVSRVLLNDLGQLGGGHRFYCEQ